MPTETNPSVHQHAGDEPVPEHLRAAFLLWLHEETRPQIVSIPLAGTKPLRWLLRQLWNCTDPLPGWAVSDLGLRGRQTYAAAVRSIARRMDKQAGTRGCPPMHPLGDRAMVAA